MRTAVLVATLALVGCESDPMEPVAPCRTGIEVTGVLTQTDTFPAPCEPGVDGACVCMG